MGYFPRIIRIVVAAPNHIDGVPEGSYVHEVEAEAVVDRSEDEHDDDHRHARAEVREEHIGHQVHCVAEQVVQFSDHTCDPSGLFLGECRGAGEQQT